jgi:D-alanyl-D-alanine carboxypeptidase (penicillin-binding protein 5/6)
VPTALRTLTRRQVYRRRRIAVFGGAAIALGALLYLPLTLLAPLEPAVARISAEEPAATPPVALDWPGYGRGAIGLLDDDEVLASYGGDEPRPIASITKIVTALVVLDKHPLAVGEAGPAVQMGAADVALRSHYFNEYRAKVFPVWAGLTFTERELLDLALIESAANYAGSLAAWAFGSDAEFATAARAWLDSHGLTDISIVEPTGLDPANSATPSALLELGRIALAHPVVAEIVGTQELTVHDVGLLENTNELLGLSGVTGIKTGTLDVYGSNLLFSANVPTADGGQITVVGVVLGGPGPKHDILDADVTELLASIQSTFHVVSLTDAGETFAGYDTEWGQTSTAVAETAASVVVWGDTPVEMRVNAESVGTGKAGGDVGEVVFTAGEQTVTVQLALSGTIEDPGPWWRLGHPGLIFGNP